MKNLLTQFILIIVLSVLSGCTKTLYTQNQVMAHYQTKSQVVAEFGFPTEKSKGDGTEEWLYKNDTVNKADSTNSLTVTKFNSYSKYQKFTFDSRGNVLKWESHGVNNAVKVKNTKWTVLSVLKSLGSVILQIVGAEHGGQAAPSTNPRLKSPLASVKN